MKRLKVYLDTSVFGAIYDTEDANRVEITDKLLELLKERRGMEPYISNVVLEEVEEAPKNLRDGIKASIKSIDADILTEDEHSAELAEEYMKERTVPSKSRDDARHIAVAVVNNMDAIITWNCKHMAHLGRKRKINAIGMVMGYHQIEIVTPMEAIEYD